MAVGEPATRAPTTMASYMGRRPSEVERTMVHGFVTTDRSFVNGAKGHTGSGSPPRAAADPAQPVVDALAPEGVDRGPDEPEQRDEQHDAGGGPVENEQADDGEDGDGGERWPGAALG